MCIRDSSLTHHIEYFQFSFSGNLRLNGELHHFCERIWISTHFQTFKCSCGLRSISNSVSRIASSELILSWSTFWYVEANQEAAFIECVIDCINCTSNVTQ